MNGIRNSLEGTSRVISSVVSASEPVLLLKTLSLMLLGASYALGDLPDIGMFLRGFIITGPMLWGGLYILNDVTDVEDDKFHPIKKNRPLPSGKASPKAFAIASVVLVGSAMVLSMGVNPHFFACIALMTFKQVLYTLPPLRFKERFLLDVFTGSVFNTTLRFLAGWFLFTARLNFPLLLLLSCECFQVSGFLVNRLYSNYSIGLETRLGYKSTVTQLSPRAFRLLTISLTAIGIVSFLFLALNTVFLVSPEVLGVLPLQSLSIFVILLAVAPFFLFSALGKAEHFSASDLRKYNDLPVFLIFFVSLFLSVLIKLYG